MVTKWWYSVYVKKKYNNSARELKAADIHQGIARRKGDWELDREKQPAGKPNRKSGKPHKLALTEQSKLQMAKDRASGMSEKELANKYSVSVTYVGEALRTLFVKSAIGRDILKGVLLDNAISCGMRVRATVDELSPMQSVIATGVMTQRYIDIDKHTQDIPKEVDFSELLEMGNLLKDLRGHAILPSEKDKDFIDIEGEVQ